MRLLLVCATRMEMQASLALLPGGGNLPRAEAPRAGGTVSPEPPGIRLPGCMLDLLICGVGPVASALTIGRYLGREQAARRLMRIKGNADVPARGKGRRPLLSTGRMTQGAAKPSAPARSACSPEPLRGILNLGLAGTYNTFAAPVGSLVLATEEAYPEYGLWRSKEEWPLPLVFPQAKIDGQEVFTRLDLAPDKALGIMGLNWHSELRRGPGVTVAGVSGTPDRAGYMAALGKGLTENMEGFSLALGAAAAGIPFVELRAVSNPAGLRPPDGWDIPLALEALGRGLGDLLAPFFRAGTRA